jgi:DNA-directed RNA polymerase sigma subunit (sigma70/sigma32)
LNDFIARFYSEYDREPTDKEIMAAVKIDARSTIEKIEMRVNPSLDDNVDQLEFEHYLTDVNSLDPGEYLEFLDILDQLRLELNNLSKPQMLAIDLRFGITTRGEELSLAEIGKKLGDIIPETVRQRIFKGIRVLRRRIEKKVDLPNPVIK